MVTTMKKILIFALSLLLLTGCGTSEEGAPDGMKTASPKEVNYILYVPEDWKVDTADNSILTAAHVEDGDNSNITMMTYTNDGELTSITAYWEDYEKGLINVFDRDSEGNTTYELLTVGKTNETNGEKETDGEKTDDAKADDENAAGEKAKLDGEDCRIYRYKGNIAGIPLQYMQVITYHNGDFYIFTYTATTQNDRYGRNEEDVARMLNEFKFKN